MYGSRSDKGRKGEQAAIENSSMVVGRTRKMGKEDLIKEQNFQLSMRSKVWTAKVQYGNIENVLR